jgi:hypothetical protein
LFIGGDQKTFKTNISMDLLVSLATGTPFLNRFPVNATKRTAIFTAEIGEFKSKILIRSILDSRGLPRAPGLDIVNEVPTFGLNKLEGKATGDAVRNLRRFMKTRKPEVVVFDPLYLTVMSGEAGDLYGMGAILNEIVKICKEHNVWAIFCHHSKKPNNETLFQPMRLTDFYGSGPAQYARQWCLVSHSEPFRNGVANLYVTIGGSTQSREDVYEVKIDEGVTDILADRRWDVTINDRSDERISVTRASVLKALDGAGAVSITQLVVLLNCQGQNRIVEKTLHELVREGEVSMVGKKYEISMGGFPNDQVK